MKNREQPFSMLFVIFIFAFFVLAIILSPPKFEPGVIAQANPAQTPAPLFNQTDAIAKLREQIKGRVSDSKDKSKAALRGA